MSNDLEILRQLIKFNTTNPPSNTRGLSNYLGKLLSKEGIRYKFLSKKGNVVYPNAIYIFSEIGAGKRCISLYGHSDVVPVGDVSKWGTDPFTPIEKDGKLYGRGATDMKSGLAVLVSTYINLAKEEEKLGGRVQLIVCPDEENYLNREKLLPEIINKHKPDACIMAEPHKSIIIGERGEMWLKFIAKGRPAHGSAPSAGEDAGIILSEAISKIRKMVEKCNLQHSRKKIKIRKLLDSSDLIIAQEFELTGKEYKTFLKSKPNSKITMNVGYVRVGHNINIVPEDAEAHISFVMPYGFDYTMLKRKILKMFDESNGKLSYTIFGGSNATLTNPDSRLVRAVSDAYSEVHGTKADIVFDIAASDAPFYRSQGIPTILHGPGKLAMAHKSNEFVEISDIKLARETITRAVKKFLQ